MPTYSTVEVRERFSDIVNEAAYGKEPVIITRRNKEVVAIVSIEDLQLLREANHALEELRREESIEFDDFKRKFLTQRSAT
jgi:prevent-host-death family protein